MLRCALHHLLKTVRARIRVQFQSLSAVTCPPWGRKLFFKKGFDGSGSGAYKPPHDAAGLVERLARGRLVRL